MNRRGENRGLRITEGPLWDQILLFALPLAATGILLQLFNAADMAVVGRFSGAAGTEAMAAIGANTFLISLIQNGFNGVVLGVTVVIARERGAGNEPLVRKAAHTALLVAAAAGLIVLAVTETLAECVLATQDIPETVLPAALLYFRIYMAGMPLILFYNFEAAIFRGTGDTKTPLLVLSASGALNVLLNLFFVVVLRRTVDGVALATVIANAAGAGVLLKRLRGEHSPARITRQELRIDGDLLRQMQRIGVPAGVQSALFSFSNVIIQRAINSLGVVAMAASSAAYQLENISYNVVNSFSQACTTFTGQNCGARRYGRCRKTLYLCLAEGLGLGACGITAVLFLGHAMLRLFTRDPEVVATGYYRLLAVVASHVFTLTYEVLSGYLRGFGISVRPAVFVVLGICGTRILWITAAFPLNRTFPMIMAAYPISLAFTSLILLILVLRLRPAANREKNSEN